VFGSGLSVVPTSSQLPLFQQEPLLGVGLSAEALEMVRPVRGAAAGPPSVDALYETHFVERVWSDRSERWQNDVRRLEHL
jgi:hypothetical protein